MSEPISERDDLGKLNIPASGKAYARQTQASLRPGRRPDMYFRMVRDLTKGPEKGFPTPDVGKDTAGKAGAGALRGGAKGPTLGHSKTVAQRAGRTMVDSLARRLVGELLDSQTTLEEVGGRRAPIRKFDLADQPRQPRPRPAKTMYMTAKCSDLFSAQFLDVAGSVVGEYEGYVPDFMPGEHYGDYVELRIDLKTGQILNWRSPNPSEIEQLLTKEPEG